MQSIALRIRQQWQSATSSDAAWLAFTVGVFYAGKLAAQLWKGVPGHAGAFWIPSLFLARALVGRSGAATVTALAGSALWCLPRGDGAFDLAAYVAAGLAIDFLMVSPQSVLRFPIALLAGALCAAMKFLVHLAPAALLGDAMHSLRWGVPSLLALHLGFGLLGGALGWGAARVVTGRPK